MNDEIRIPWFHGVANSAMRLVFPLFFRTQIEGLENAPKQGPLIVAINHTCFLDPFMSITFIRPDILPMAKIELFNGPLGLLFKHYGAFPVRRGQGDLSAIRAALRILQEGHAMLISPEGHRADSGSLQTPHEGVAFIAHKSSAPILPVANWGGKLFARNMKHFRRTDVRMRIGEPLELLPLEGKPSRQVLTSITDEMMGYIARLLPRKYRGRYEDAENYTPRYLRVIREGKTESGTFRRKEVRSVRV